MLTGSMTLQLCYLRKGKMMKRKLRLSRETLRSLELANRDLKQAAGGYNTFLRGGCESDTCRNSCFTCNTCFTCPYDTCGPTCPV